MMQTDEEIKQYIKAEIENGWEGDIVHGLDLRQTLVEPHKVKVNNWSVHEGQVNEEIIEVWLVLEELPDGRGYKIVFDSAYQQFGLAIPPGLKADSYPVFLGFYGDFWTTLKAM